MKQELYEILIPTTFEDTKKPVRTKHHKEWDKFVHKIAGGSTILSPCKGYWIDNGKTYQDRVIPVRIMCTKKQMNDITDFTLQHYRQVAVLAYKISDTIILKRASDASNNKRN